MSHLETDYLVIGTGAVGMAFTDTLLSESGADIVMVDRHHMPGGHWNDAYPFVRLHQPSAFYGVASEELGSRRIDDAGPNRGFYELASGSEVAAYFDRVMRNTFLPSGRVRYFPMHDCIWDDDADMHNAVRFRSLLSGEEHTISVRKRIVDGTFYNTSVPSTHSRKFHVAPGATCIAPNSLPRLAPQHRSFAILGGGKTAMDVGVWLLENGADPEAITWVRPRESWLLNRATTQPGIEFFQGAIGGFANQMAAIAAARSVEDLFERLEAAGNMLRIDRDIFPEMFHYATISEAEVALLRRIDRVIRGEKVTAIVPGRMALSGGGQDMDPDTLYIDCTATAVIMPETRPTFEDRRITLQMVRIPQPAFSAAVVAHVEAAYDTDEERNRLCPPIPLPDRTADWMKATLANMMNQFTWSQDPDLRDWITACRLDGFSATIQAANPADPAQGAVLKRLQDNAFPAVENLQTLIAAQNP